VPGPGKYEILIFSKSWGKPIKAPNEHEGLAGRQVARVLRIQQLQRRIGGPFRHREQRLRDREDRNLEQYRLMDEVAAARGENDNADANVDAANPAYFDRFMIADNDPIPPIRASKILIKKTIY
jgi:hypothetical protein